MKNDEKNKRKNLEINFLEQTFLLLNSEQNNINYIHKSRLSGLLKIIYEPEGTIKEIENILYNYFEAAFLLKPKNKNYDKIYITPLLNKKITGKELWNLNKYLKNFFELKKNILAYKTINEENSEKYNSIVEEKKKQFSFEPNSTEKNKNIKFNFNKLYQKFMEKEKNRSLNLAQLRAQKTEKELSELKQKPTISDYKNPNSADSAFYSNKGEKIYDRLYNMDKVLKAKKLEKIEEKLKEENEKMENDKKNYKLHIDTKKNIMRMNKSFEGPQEYCKGWNEYIKRNKKAILEKLRVKYLLEKKPVGENYYEIKKRNITPPNITDIRNMEKKDLYKTMNYINRNTKNLGHKINKTELFEETQSEDNDEYFSIEIKLTNGQKKLINVYENDDPEEVVDEFCKVYSIDNNVKEKLVKNIKEFQKKFLSKTKNTEENNHNNNNDEHKREEEEEEEEEENIINVNKDENSIIGSNVA